MRLEEYQEESGTCRLCANLSSLRAQTNDWNIKRRLTIQQTAHNWSCKAEMQCYFERIQACRELDNDAVRCSMATDGMMRAHTVFPNMGRKATFPKPLRMHVQGTISHGRKRHILRTFHNVACGTNVAVHELLSDIEFRRIELNGEPIARYDFHSDGGSENWNKALIAIAELIVAHRIVLHLTISRNVAHHSEGDVDQWFSAIHKKVRFAHLHTPKSYADVLKTAVQLPAEPVHVEDRYILANFKVAGEALIRRGFSNFAKLEHSIHYIDIKAVPRDADFFPFGTKVTYKHYCQEVYRQVNPNDALSDIPDTELIKLRSSPLYPLPTEERPVAGTYFLRQWPTEKPGPAPFIPHSHEDFLATHEAVKREFNNCPATLTEWESWYTVKIPHTNDAEKYRISHPEEFKIPLDIIFAQPNLENDIDFPAPELAQRIVPFEDNLRQSSFTGRRGKGKRKVGDAEVVDAEVEDEVFDWEIIDQPIVLYRGISGRKLLSNSLNLADYVGRTFQDLEFSDPNDLRFGKVVSIVTSAQNKGFFFKYYCPTLYPDEAPCNDPRSEKYVEDVFEYKACSELLNKKKFKWLQ